MITNHVVLKESRKPLQLVESGEDQFGRILEVADAHRYTLVIETTAAKLLELRDAIDAALRSKTGAVVEEGTYRVWFSHRESLGDE